MAIVVALVAMLSMSAIGAALLLTTTSEALIASNFEASFAGQYAADAALERAMDDLAGIADWSAVLSGAAQSTFTDGSTGGVRSLADGSRLDLDRARNILNCRKPALCSAADLVASTRRRPWGANNPDWRLFAYGPLTALLPTIDSSQYVVVFVGDDPAENDGDPLRDGAGQANPGAGMVRLRSEAFGPRGAHQTIEITVARGGSPAGVRVLTWHRAE